MDKYDKLKRRQIQKQPGFVIWLTGLSGSGKSTLAMELECELWERGIHNYILDGDLLRAGLNRDLGFSEADRSENIRRAGELARLFIDAGLVVVCAFIAPFEKDRQMVRDMFQEGKFVEVYLQCDLATCCQRDPKGLYKQAVDGKIKDFTGFNSPYEIPQAPELVLDTARAPIDECVKTVLEYLMFNKIL